MLRNFTQNLNWLILLIGLLAIAQSCKSTSYPCPKKNDSRSAQLSKGGNDGAMPTGSSRGNTSKKNNGLVKKKEPKRIHNK